MAVLAAVPARPAETWGLRGGRAPGCNALAALYESGLGVTRNLAGDLYAQACAAGYQPACAKKATPPK